MALRCNCFLAPFTFLLMGLSTTLFSQNLQVVADTVTICGPGVPALGVKVSGGAFPYEFQWNTGAAQQNITPFVANSSNFRVTVTDALGVTATATARAIVNPVPSAQFLTPVPTLCAGQNAILDIQFKGSGPFSFEYTVNQVPQAPITGIVSTPFALPVNLPGLYQITKVTDSGNCPGRGEGAVYVEEDNLELVSTVKNLNCFGLSGGAILTQAKGGAGPYTYVWSGPTPIGNESGPINLLPGQYALTLSDTRGCILTRQFEVAQAPLLSASIDRIKPLDCNAGGSIALNVAGGVKPYKYQWDNGLTTPTPQNLPAGAYAVTITDDEGCTTTLTASVAQNTTMPVAAASASGMLTCSQKTVQLDGTGSSTGANFIYRWEAEPGNVVNGVAALRPTVNQPGTYKLVVINQANGCSSVASVSVNSDNNYPISNPGPDQKVNCIVKNATFDGTGSSTGLIYTYRWIPPAGSSVIGGNTSLRPTVMGPGTYTLVVTNNANGCTSTATVDVLNDAIAPIAKIDTSGVLSCSKQVLTLDGGLSKPGGDSLTYLWSTTNGFIASSPTTKSVSISAAGTYTLVVQDKQNGCTAETSTTVQGNFDLPNVSAKVDEFLSCARSSVILDGRGTSLAGGLKYEWTSGPNGNFVSGKNSLTPVVNAPGIYHLIVTNPTTNCSATASVLVQEDLTRPEANTGLPAKLSCRTHQIPLGDPNDTPDPILRYSWSHSPGGNIVSGALSPNPVIDQPGTYSLTVTDTYNSCTASASVTITRDTIAPKANATPTTRLTCDAVAVLLDGTGSSTGALYQYEWQGPSGGIASGGTTLSPLVSLPGVYTLVVTNEDNGCTATASTDVTGNAGNVKAVASISGIITCDKPIVALDAVGSSSGSGISYRWGTINGRIIAGPNSAVATTDQTGKYTLIVTDAATGCSATTSVTVQADVNPPRADAGTDKLFDCTKPIVNLDGNNSNQGTFMRYQWSIASNYGKFLGPTDKITAQVNEPGNYQLLVTNTQNGCTATDNVMVNPDPQSPFAILKSSGEITCLRPESTLDATGSSNANGFSLQWSGPGILPSGANPLLRKVNRPGIYTLTVVNTSNSCKDTAVLEIKENLNPPLIDIGPNQRLDCKNIQRVLRVDSDPNYTYLWVGPGLQPNTSTNQVIITQDGTYRVTVTNITNGCVDDDIVTVTSDFTKPTADAGATFQLTCFQTNYTIPATGSQGNTITYAWSTTGGNFISQLDILQPIVNGAGRYYLTVTDNSNGCTATDDVQIYQSADVPVASAGLPRTITCNQPVPVLDGSGSGTGLGIVYKWGSSPGGRIVSGGNSTAPSIDRPATYFIMVTDTFISCSAYSSVIVGIDTTTARIGIAPPQPLNCISDTVTLRATNTQNGNFSYNWVGTSPQGIVTSDTTLTIGVTQAGIYRLTAVSRQNGCAQADSISVIADTSKPIIRLLPHYNLDCRNRQVLLSSQVDNQGAISPLWTTTDGRILGEANALQVAVDQQGRYALVVENRTNGCIDSISTMVALDTLAPVVEAGPLDTLTCKRSSTTLNGSIMPNDTTYFYEWLTSDGQILFGGNSLKPIVGASGTYVLVAINERNGCVGQDMVMVVDDTKKPYVSIQNPSILTCKDTSILLDGSGSDSGTGLVYAWITTGGNFTGRTDSMSTTANAPGAYTLNILNTLNGCSNSASTLVSANTVLPVAEAGQPFTLTCSVEEDNLQAFASGGPLYAYAWSTLDGNIIRGDTTLKPLVNQPGTYYFKVTNLNTGCVSIDSVNVNIERNRPDSIALTLDSITCKTDAATLHFLQIRGGIGPYAYSIDGGSNYSTETRFKNLKPGDYSLQVSDVNGCTYTQTLTIPDAPIPKITIDPEEIQAKRGDPVRIEALLPPGYPLYLVDSIHWTPVGLVAFRDSSLTAKLSPTLVPQRTATFAVTITSKDGCTSTDRLLLRIDNSLNIYIPNGFSPDSKNPDNRIVAIYSEDNRIVQIKTFRIFDRWGSMMHEAKDFQPNDVSAGWDGTWQGKRLAPAVFAYYLEVELTNGDILPLTGDTFLMR